MIFTETPLPGVLLVDIEPREDARGFFARTVCAEEFAARGLDAGFVQSSVSFNRRAGTLRGMHYQAAPYGEIKLVRCLVGAVWDVVVDLRRDSPTRGRWTATTLSAENRRAIYIPKGVAHGYMTLADGAELLYQMTVPYAPAAARGVRWDDPDLAIAWPDGEKIVAERDLLLPTLAETPPEPSEA